MNREPILMAALVLIAFIIGGLYATYFYNLGKSIVPTTLPKTTTTTKTTTITTITTTTSKEKLDIVSGVSMKINNQNYIVVVIKNTGKTTTVINKITVCNIPVKSLYYLPGDQILVENHLVKGLKTPINEWMKTTNITINPGETITIAIIPPPDSCYAVVIYTTNGGKYPITIM